MNGTNLYVTVGVEKDLEAVASALEKIVSEKYCSDNDIATIEIDSEELTIEWGETFMISHLTFTEEIENIFKELIAKLPNVVFRGEAICSSYNSAYELIYRFDCNGDRVLTEVIETESYWAYCSECGCEITNAEDYDPNKKYICPDCGEELDLEEMFGGCLPTVMKTECEIANGELVRK